ncbi:hypothetical protein INT47_010256 [Mucor saturninus]|uniref:Uncharacterized protein n=1 Tax=Mucor saturninus TaxID=64648 RepID=A0A8H7RDW9_9FUNG|nr:hypothetical protein INT47_010256 [Mucor saturninus]
MLKARYKPKRLYWVLIVYVTIGVTYAVCDTDDVCLKFSSTTSIATSSYFSFLPTDSSLDSLSDFHEAKVARPKNNQNNPETLTPVQAPVIIKDDINEESLDNNEDFTGPLPGLSNIETGILGACGILVVAGIAVGIFVWKNTSRRSNLRQNHELPISDEEGDDFDYMKQLNNKQGISVPLPAIYRDDFFSNWQRRNGKHNDSNFQYEPRQKSPMVKVISEKQPLDLKFQIPAFEHAIFNSEQEANTGNNKISLNVEEDYIITAKHLRNSDYGPMFSGGLPQANITRPSALDPTYDPTAITYQLQKFLKSAPALQSVSPMEISLNLESDEEPKEIVNGSLGHQLSKLLLTENMVQVDLNEPENAKITLSNLQKAYQGLEQERRIVHLQESSTEKRPAQSFIQDYKDDYFKKHGTPFMSSLDLPDDKYIPLRNASGPELISRAKVLADPVLRLGQDEIALWEQGRIKKELKRLSYEMWDEQVLREEIEEDDRKLPFSVPKHNNSSCGEIADDTTALSNPANVILVLGDFKSHTIAVLSPEVVTNLE